MLIYALVFVALILADGSLVYMLWRLNRSVQSLDKELTASVSLHKQHADRANANMVGLIGAIEGNREALDALKGDLDRIITASTDAQAKIASVLEGNKDAVSAVKGQFERMVDGMAKGQQELCGVMYGVGDMLKSLGFNTEKPADHGGNGSAKAAAPDVAASRA